MQNVTHYSKYCTLCGNCAAICPSNAVCIKKEFVSVNENCTHCGLCIKNCPGYEFNYNEFNYSLFGKTNIPYSNHIGHYKDILIGKSLDNKILKKASSGGIVTTILIKALEKKLVDGAIITTFDSDFSPITKIAATKQEILDSPGSKYTITSPNKLIKELEKGKTYAFVGLPCQIQGIRLLQKNNHLLAKQIKFCIGIFCGRTMSSEAVDYIFKKLKISSADVKSFSYRSGSWPKGFFVETSSKQYFLHKYYYDLFNLMFNPKRCLVCPDYTNEFADVSVGDCWLREKKGYSTIIARSKEGKKLISNAKNEIQFQRSNVEDLVKTHPNFKYKEGALIRGRWLGIFPTYHLQIKEYNYLKTKIFYLIIKGLMTRTAKKIVNLLPLKLIGFAVHTRRWLAGLPRNWALEDVGDHWDRTEDYDDINKKTYSYFRRFTDGDRLSDIKSGSYILDICCRTGNGAIYFAKQRNVYGICMDVSDKMLKIAGDALKQENINFTTRKFMDYNLPAKDNEFDAVLCFETIEHIPDVWAFTKELNRVIKPGGEAIITMPNFLWEPIHWFAAVIGIHHSEGPHRFLQRKKAIKIIKDAGFSIKKEETTVLIPYGPKFLTDFGEKMENIFKNSLMPLLGLRRIFICEKIDGIKND